MYKCLKMYGFGPDFIDWVRVLYHGANSHCIINGETTGSFFLERSMRQGCGLSMLLFIITLEPFLSRIRHNPHISGFRNTNGNIIKQIAYADDVTFILSNPRTMASIFDEFADYSKVSGAQLNINKTEILNLGQTTRDKVPEQYRGYINH